MSAKKQFKLFDLDCPEQSTSKPASNTNWECCIICQEDTKEPLTSPSQVKRTDLGSGYTSLAENLIKFHNLGQLPCTFRLERLDEGCGIDYSPSRNP